VAEEQDSPSRIDLKSAKSGVPTIAPSAATRQGECKRGGAHVVPVIGTIETSPMRSRAEAAVERQRFRVRLARMFRGWRCILIAFASLMIGVGAASGRGRHRRRRAGTH
jgi:hypothetical protein